MYDLLHNCLNKAGCFITSGGNVMTLGWAGVGGFFNKKVIIAPVRVSRFTREKIDQTGCFSLSIPNGMSKELAFCGTKSGRNINKVEVCGLQMKDCKSIDAHIVCGCKEYYECKVLFALPMDKASVPSEISDRFYSNGDMHILYFAEIVEQY